jgi:hypothetical protein
MPSKVSDVAMPLAEVDRLIALVKAWADSYPVEAVIALWEGRAWIAKRHANWQALCEAEFTPFAGQLTVETRLPIIAALRSAGMSTRAIGPAVGLGKSQAAYLTQVPGHRAPDRVIGTDGRSYPAIIMPTPEQLAVAEEAMALVRRDEWYLHWTAAAAGFASETAKWLDQTSFADRDGASIAEILRAAENARAAAAHVASAIKKENPQ